MKKNFFKTIFSLAMAVTLAFSGVGSSLTGLETVEAAKVVQPATLAQVTGIGYNSSRYYEVNKSDGYDESYKDTTTNKYKYYKYVTGPSATTTINTGSQTVVTNSITKLPSIAWKETQQNNILFKPVGISNLNKGEYIRWEYANNAQFKNGETTGYYAYTSGSTDSPYSTYSVSIGNFSPGETVYVRARVYNSNYEKASGTTETADKFGPYTKTVTYTIPKSKITSVDTRVEANSVIIKANISGKATGYQFAKKVKNKWVTLGTQTSHAYTDKGLDKNTTYQYRVRSYHYNQYTKKTVWTEWKNTEAVTWGSSLCLKADAANTTSVKLTWKPVSGAEGYEIYRYDKPYDGNITEKGQETMTYSKGTLVKTIKGSKKKTYTDKKLIKGQTYTYTVKAYKTINKKKCYIEDSAEITMQAGTLKLNTEYYTAAGKKVVTWSKMAGVKGYYVEKYDPATEQYALVKKLSAKAVSYTFPKVDVESDTVKYRIRPYDGTNVYTGVTISIVPKLAAVKNVKAVKSGNGIRISWSPVAGADYYKVCRTSSSSLAYDKTTKTYTAKGDYIKEVTFNNTGCTPQYGGNGYNSAGTYSSNTIYGTSILDATVTYTKPSIDNFGSKIAIGKDSSGKTLYQTEEAVYYQGPEAGTTYYYYVIAYSTAANGNYSYTTVQSVGCTKPASVTYTNKIAKKVSKITTATSKKKGQVTIKYKKVSGVDGYAIYRSAKKNGTYTMVGTSTKTTFTDNSAKSGKTHYYKVASYVKGEKKANIYSAKTPAKKVKVK